MCPRLRRSAPSAWTWNRSGRGDFDGLADVALTPRERLALRRLPSEQRSSAALTWWVRKEAVLKATGDGMFVAPADMFTSTEVVYGVTGTDVTRLPEYGVSP